MGLLILALWGCIPELTKNCVDMTSRDKEKARKTRP